MRWPSRWPSIPTEIGGRLDGRRSLFSARLLLLGALLVGPAAHAEESGKDLFGNFCASCHGLDGRAKTSPGHYYRIPDWTTTDATKKLKDDQVRKQIRTGKLQENQSGMPAFRSLSDAQVDLLIAFVRKLSTAAGN
jgi:mono/diheme cytochrome c family protein